MKKLGFGCMRLPVKDQNDQTTIDMDSFCELVDTFLERGFTYFDTALAYHNFRSENFVREALVERHPRDSFKLATKLPPRMITSQSSMNRSLPNSWKNAVSISSITTCSTI